MSQFLRDMMSSCPAHRTMKNLLIRILLFTLLCANSNLNAADPIVIAHRGASGYLPEHTLEAVSLAYGMGAHYIEQDVVLSKDDCPVVLHDIHIDTVTDVAKQFPARKRADGRYYAIDFTLAELKLLHVHERTDADGKPVFPKRFPQGKSQFRIATLEEELELIQGLNHSTRRDVGIYPEIKQPAWHREQGHDITKIVLSTLKAFGYSTKQDKAFLQCFDVTEVKRIRTELKSELLLIQLLSKGQAEVTSSEGLSELSKIADGIGPSLDQILLGYKAGKPQLTDLVARAHANGLQIHPYTFRSDALPAGVKSLDELVRLFVEENKIDGLFTDFPDLCVDALSRLSK